MDTQLSKPILLDGALATNLYKLGMSKEDYLPLWVLNNKEKVINLQKDFVNAGSKIIYTPTFGCNKIEFEKLNTNQQYENVIKELVSISKEAVKGTDAKIAGCISSIGITLQPFGDSTYTEILNIYREQASILIDCGVDYIVVETLTSIAEARIAAIALQKFDVPKFITMSVDKDGMTPFGGNAVNALVILQELGITAFGLNCSYGAEYMVDIIKDMKNYAKIPIIAKPSACSYDEQNNTFNEISPLQMAMFIKKIANAKVGYVGGCCMTTPQHIECMAVALDEFDCQFDEQHEETESKGDITLADIRQIYNLYCDNIEFSDMLECSIDMTDDLLKLEEDSKDVILLKIDTIDDAIDFSKNAHITKLPVCFHSHDKMALKLALMLYTGRAMVDSNSSIDRNTLEKMAKKYGAVIY